MPRLFPANIDDLRRAYRTHLEPGSVRDALMNSVIDLIPSGSVSSQQDRNFLSSAAVTGDDAAVKSRIDLMAAAFELFMKGEPDQGIAMLRESTLLNENDREVCIETFPLTVARISERQGENEEIASRETAAALAQIDVSSGNLDNSEKKPGFLRGIFGGGHKNRTNNRSD